VFAFFRGNKQVFAFLTICPAPNYQRPNNPTTMASNKQDTKQSGIPDALKPKKSLRDQLAEDRAAYETAAIKGMTEEQKEKFANEVLDSFAKKGKYVDVMTLREMYVKDNSYFLWYVRGIVMKESPAAARLLNGMLGLGIKF
jgi:hypothetical protein